MELNDMRKTLDGIDNELVRLIIRGSMSQRISRPIKKSAACPCSTARERKSWPKSLRKPG